MGWKMVDHRLHQWLNLSSHLRLVFTDYLYLQYNIQVCRVEPRWSISIFRLSFAQLQRVWKGFFYPHSLLARALGWKVKYLAYFGGLNRWDHPRNTKTKVWTHIGDSDSSWTPALALASESVPNLKIAQCDIRTSESWSKTCERTDYFSQFSTYSLLTMHSWDNASSSYRTK